MRIAFLVGDFPVLSETFIVNKITGLMERGHQVDIYGHCPENLSKVHPNVEKFKLISHTYYQPKLPRNYFWRFLKALWLILVNFHKSPLLLWRSLNFLQYGRRASSLRLLYSVIPFLNKREPYDIIHGQFGCYGVDGMILREIGAIEGKLVTSFRGSDISKYIQKNGERVYDELFIKGDLFLANCEFFRKKAIKLGCPPEKISVQGSGIDCAAFPFCPRHIQPNEIIRLVTVGRLVEKKGIEYSIRAVAKIADIYPNIEYQVIGNGHLREYLEQLIKSLNVTDKIQLVGWKNQTEIVEILQRSHLFIAPSVTSTDGDQDAPVNTLKEAMLMGLPVISTYHGGIPELVQDGISGFLVPERDDNAIAEKLIYLLQHPEIWPQLGTAGRQYVEAHYDNNKLNDQLVRFYQQLITNNAPITTPKPILDSQAIKNL
jgi:colanic acid/amylovoran biosynthesis glycosyltransferase